MHCTKHFNYVVKQPRNVLIPTEYSEKLSEKFFFTVLDLKEGFWQIKPDKELIDLCNFPPLLFGTCF